MTPYANFLRIRFFKLIVRLPLQVLLLLQNSDRPEDEGEEKEIFKEEKEAVSRNVTELIANRKTFQSKYVKQIFKTVKTQLPVLVSECCTGVTTLNLKEIEKTVKLIGQLLTLNEINDLIVDFSTFVEEVTEHLSESGHDTGSNDYKELCDGLKQLFLRCASPTKSLNDLLTELSFQVFFLVADADNVIDKDERAGYQKILKDREWCSGQFSHLCFAKTEYSYDDLYAQVSNKKLRIDMKEVKRTLRITDQLFKVKEVNLLKMDLYRLSKEIAKASGGIGGIGAISKKEKIVLDLLESYLGDFAVMQTSISSRQIDQVASLMGGAEEDQTRAGAKQPKGSDSSRGDSTVIHDPSVTVSVKADNKDILVKALSITKKRIQCRADLTEGYVDLIQGVILTLTVPQPSAELKIEKIRCKTTRITVLKWDDHLKPTQFKIDWTFFGLAPERQKIIDDYVDGAATNHS